MGDLLQKAFEGISSTMAPDPNNPFPTPTPGFGEYVAALLGGIGQHPRAGPVTRGIGSLAGFTGQEMARRRTDPLQRALAASQAGIEAAKGITVPVPGVPEQLPSYPNISPSFARDLETAYGGEAGNVITTPEIPATTRAPSTFPELLANARPGGARAIAAARLSGTPEDLLFTKPPSLQFQSPGTYAIDPTTQKPIYQLPPMPSQTEQFRQLQVQGQAMFQNLVSEGIRLGKYKSRHEAEVGVGNEYPQLVPFLPIETQGRMGKEPTITEFDKKRDVVARDLFKIPFSQITDPKQQAKVDAEVSKRYKETPAITIVTAGMGERERLLGERSADPSTTYLDPQGNEVHPTTNQDTRGLIALKGPPQKAFLANRVGTVHIGLELDSLTAIGNRMAASGTRPSQWLKLHLAQMMNDPDIVAWEQTLGPFSATALAQMATEGMSVGGRAWNTLKMMREALPNIKGDDMTTSLSKLDKLSDRLLNDAKLSGLPQNQALELKDRIKALRERFGIGQSGGVPSIPGRATSGGGAQTWIRDPQTGQLRPQ